NQEEQVVWQCTLKQFSEWTAHKTQQEITAYDFLYGIASRHGLTPLLSREITHTAVVSLLAGVNLHENLPRIEGCWDICLRAVLSALRPEPWLETPTQKIRFHALHLLLSRRATNRTTPGDAGLSSVEIRALLRLAQEATLEHTNIAHVSFPAIRRGFDRILARDDTREMLDSLLLHVGTAYETEIWGQVRKFIVLDVINDLLALTIRSSLLHLVSSD